MTEFREKADVCVIGAGHAGCEAALACARIGLQDPGQGLHYGQGA